MQFIVNIANIIQSILDTIRGGLEFIGGALLRLYLVPIFWVAGNNKWNPFDPDSSLDSVIEWFDQGLGLPYPEVNAYLAWGAEYVGAILLAVGLATRWICLPMMVTMVVAMVTVHLKNGWQAIVDPLSPFAPATAGEAIERLDAARSLLKQYEDYDWLTEYGSFVVLNNGIEWPATYFLLLLALFFIGGGRYISLDYWIKRRFGY